MEWITYLLCLFVGLLTFYAYRQGVRDGAALSRQEPLPERKQFIKTPPQSKEEPDLIRQYEEIMGYDFDRAGETHDKP